jgi:hypothetical protein
MTMRRLSSLRVELPLRRLIGVSMVLGFSWLHAQCVPQAPDLVVISPPLGPSGAYLWGQQVQIDATSYSSYSGDFYRIEYSLDEGISWTTAAPNVTSFPVTITLPAFTPPTYTATLLIRAVAVCNSPSQESPGGYNSINLSDRLGNRPTIPIPITLNLSGAVWRATISDSTNGLATSDEYNAATGARWGSASRDLFFVLTLPECLDSLVVNTCSRNTNFDTRIHFINANTNDTITNDDMGRSCTSAGGSVNPNWLSQLVVFGLPNALRVTQTIRDDIGYGGSAKVVRDTALLVSGHTLYIVVEGSLSGDRGKFELTITGYKIRPSSIDLTGAPDGPVCINSGPITLDATTPGATAYEWLDADGNTIATGPTYIFDPNSEGIFNVTAKVIFNPNEDPDCDYDFLTEEVTITVEDIAQAQIADANNDPVSNQTLTITEGDDVTLTVFSPQTFGNTYTWNLYNSIPPSGMPISTGMGSSFTISNISAGDYTVVLEAVRGLGACGTTQDIVYLNVTTGLRTDAGTFSIFPNPNTGAFTIVAPAMDTYRVQVLDVAGRLVAEDAFTGSTHQMRVSLPAGIYQVRLIADEKVQVGRLIITE